MKKERLNTIKFPSATKPGKVYETALYVDGTVSCNCPGWIFNKARTCKHTRTMAPVAAMSVVTVNR